MACCVLVAYLLNRALAGYQLLDNLGVTGSKAPAVSHQPEPCSQHVTARISISGMFCGACSAKIEGTLGQLDGVSRAVVSLPFSHAKVAYDGSKVSVEDIIRAVDDLGYEATVGKRSGLESIRALQHQEEFQRLRYSFSGTLLCSFYLAFLDLSSKRLPDSLISLPTVWWTRALLGLSIACWIQYNYAFWIHRNAFRSFKSGQLTEDTLISVTQGIGIALSIFNLFLLGPNHETYFSTCALLILVITFRRHVNVLLRARSALGTVSLFRRKNEMAQIRVHKGKNSVPAFLLEPEDEIVIDPFTTIPCDCYIVEGASTVDQSVITGESLPIRKSVGDFLLSGTQNLQDPLTAVVYKSQEESTLELILDSVMQATEQKTDIESRLGGLMRNFVSLVVLIAMASAVVAYRNTPASVAAVYRLNRGAQRAMAVLAGACPCALGLATPAAMMSFLDVANSKGILLTQGARTIETLGEISHIVLDKTGTLTQGSLEVSACLLTSPIPIERHVLLQLLCTVEEPEAQAHPVAKAIFSWALRELRQTGSSHRFQHTKVSHASVLGKGAICHVEVKEDIRHCLCVGNLDFLESRGVFVPIHRHKERPTGITVHIGVDGVYCGWLLLQDTPRPEAAEVIQVLKNKGIHLTMLTGDHENEAQRISNLLEIPVLASRALPSDKRSFISCLQSEGHKVAMVGDGVNDGPALAAAEIGVQLSPPRSAIGGVGNVLFTHQSLHYLPSIFDMGRVTMQQARLTILWALLYNTMALLYAVGTFDSMGLKANASITGTMMALSSSIVLASSLLLRTRLRRIVSR